MMNNQDNNNHTNEVEYVAQSLIKYIFNTSRREQQHSLGIHAASPFRLCDMIVTNDNEDFRRLQYTQTLAIQLKTEVKGSKFNNPMHDQYQGFIMVYISID
jgi:aspartyl/asparaginyl-tRNA synthetase